MPGSGSLPRRSSSTTSTLLLAVSTTVSADPFQVSIGGNADQQLVVDLLVDFKFRMPLEELANSGPWIVSGTPGPIRKEFRRQFLDDSIEDHAVAAHGSKMRIGFKFGQHMVVGMIAIEAHNHALPGRGDSLHLFHDFTRNAGTLNHLDAAG